MKKFLVFFVSVLLIGSSAFAQDGTKTFKKANRLLGTYNLDPGANADKLEEARVLIEEALQDPEVEAMSKAWALKGKIYNERISKEINQRILNPEHVIPNLEDALVAYEAFLKAHETAAKKFEFNDALSGLRTTEGYLSNAAISAFTDKDYGVAFENFLKTIELNDFFVANGQVPSFMEDSILQEQYFYTAISGFYAQDFEGAIPVFEKAITIGNPDPFIYEGLYLMLKDADSDKALKYLNEGRAKHPNDTSLLYAEINYMVSEGMLEDLISKLENAVEMDPENISVYTTLGSVYDNLSTQAAKDGDKEKSQKYFDKALEWFNSALEKEPNNFDALYSLGALYYNKAASYTDALNELANDFSKEGNKKYDALKVEMDNLFDKSFPFFQRAEKINDKDINTLLAIKEIYARQNDIEKSNEYKERIEALQN